ncbi:MAG: DoxX family protein [Nitrospira sp.]|nr:DoxX family protein [Nitrospira sp.]MEC4688210.1 DoxX family protein [Nitrospirota bacterium]
MVKKLFQTDGAWSSLILRVALGVVMFPHGAQKLLGWYGGHGLAGTLGFFTEQMHIPWIIVLLIIIGESFGSVGLIVGLLTRFAAASLAVIMLGAITMVHWPHGFFMNWFGQQAGEGFEYHLLVLGICLALVVSGGGRWSADGVIAERLRDY